MDSDKVSKWLTLGANFGVLIGIILLIAELNQNTLLMRAQNFNDRTSQGMDLFVSVAESPELSEIEGLLSSSGFPDNAAAFSDLTLTQKTQYLWFIRADRFRIENLLYQQALGVSEFDVGPVNAAHSMIRIYEAIAEDDNSEYIREFRGGQGINRLRRLVSEVEKLAQGNN